MRHVKIVNAGLYDDFAKLNLTTGEIIKENGEKPIRKTISMNGYKHDMAIRRFQIDGKTDHYLVIILNSKMLREKYFEGLDRRNINDIYKEFIGLSLVEFSWEDFLHKTYCTDIDFCLDYQVNNETFNQHRQSLMRITPNSKHRDLGYKCYKNGVEWNNRATATNRHPFLKLYDKEQELWNRSGVFTDKYLSDDEVENRKRVEFTVKNANHLMELNVLDSSLDTVLGISQLERLEMMKTIMNKIFDVNLSATVDCSADLKPDRAVLAQALSFMYANGMDKRTSTDYLIANLNPNNKAKYRKKLNDLWKSNINDLERDDDNIFKIIGFQLSLS